MKRKNFKEPPNINTFGQWLYSELFKRNITIMEMAIKVGCNYQTLRHWMRNNKIPAYRILQICAILANTRNEYNKLITNAMQAMPTYESTYTLTMERKQ